MITREWDCVKMKKKGDTRRHLLINSGVKYSLLHGIA